MANPAGSVEPQRPRTSLAQAAIYASIGLVLFAGEFSSWSNATGERASITTLACSAAMCAAVLLTGWFPFSGGLFFVTISTAIYLVGVPVAFPTLGLYAVVALWISKGWLAASVVALVLTGATEIIFSGTPAASAVAVATGTAFAVPVGFLLRHSATRIMRERQRSERYRAQAEVTLETVSKELAVYLHNSVMRDLVGIALLSRAANEGSDEYPRFSRIQDLSLDAMSKVRELGDSFPTSRVGDGKTLTHVLEECQALLASRRIRLHVDIAALKRAKLSNAAQSTLNVALLEATTNILKFAPQGTTATILSSMEDGLVSVVISNDLGDSTVNPGPLSGGLGLTSLSAELSRLGRDLYYWVAGKRWVLTLYLPLAADGADIL